MFCYPETLGLVMATQLLIGRYTGYRLMELFRLRDFLEHQPVILKADAAGVMTTCADCFSGSRACR